MQSITLTSTNVDALRADWIAAEAIEQIAKEAYEKDAGAELWLAHQRAPRLRHGALALP